MDNDVATGAASSRRSSRLRVPGIFTAGVAAALVIVVASTVAAAGERAPSTWRVLVGLVLLGLGSLPAVRIRGVGTFSLYETALCLSILLLPVAWLPLLAAIATVPAAFLTGNPRQRSVYIGASLTVSTAAAVVVGWLLAGQPSFAGGFSAATFGALLLIVLVGNIASAAVVIPYVSEITGANPWSILRNSGRLPVVQVVSNMALACGIYLVAEFDPYTLLVAPPVAILLVIQHRLSARATQDRDAWQELEGAARELSLLDEMAVATEAVRHAVRIFRTDAVELVFSRRANNELYTVRGTVAGTVETLPGGELLPAELTQKGPQRIVHQHATLWSKSLKLGEDRQGALRLIGEGDLALNDREQQLLRTFSHTVSTALLNATLHEQVLEDAERKAFEAEHDGLTGLGNRLHLHERAKSTLETAGEAGLHCGLLLLDLDHFKEVNEALGHNAGDELLKSVADRLAAHVRENDLVVRLSGDEFAVLLADLPHPGSADNRAHDILRRLAEPAVIENLRLSIEGTIGVACYPDDATDLSTLLKRADVAMHQAKKNGESVAHYRIDRDESSVERLALTSELRSALANDELVLHFQPKVRVGSGELAGFEALVRWQHPARGLLLPGEFIPTVEQSGLVREFTLTVLDKAVAEAALWERSGTPASIAVNLSARNLLDRDLPAGVEEVLRRHRVPAERLILEITETVMMSELDVVDTVLSDLCKLGVAISVDDFGTGYSSLTFLQRVPLSEVKIDRSFVSAMLESSSAAAIVRATVDLAHALDLRVVAEGIETVTLERALVSVGCDMAQGYHFGRPASADVARSMLSTRWRAAAGSRTVVPFSPRPRG